MKLSAPLKKWEVRFNNFPRETEWFVPIMFLVLIVRIAATAVIPCVEPLKRAM